ncbi:response regulator transcription factor [Sulfurimonas sp. SAG-AH-194-I05]|nr:response regulator transcription factor [Sulfurimonas sp. SAG-AH-194-I05]MDF1874681.1 response regulator transcription factor [Sulfurimonas sp. SAG-AH-194-I05]
MITSIELKKYTQNLSILFVEDHKDIRESTKVILENFFHVVDTANDGEKGLKQYNSYYKKQNKYYDIVLSDIQMPNMNGIDLTKNIYDTNPKQIIIILSAYDESKYLLSLINLGIEQFIKKPIDFTELLGTFLHISKKILQEIDVVYIPTIEIAKNTIYSKDTKSLSYNQKNIHLTKFEILFIELLTQNFGKIYSNDEIVEYYAKLEETIDYTNIRKLVSKLRKKIPENSLESIYGVGYKFTSFT